jgi:hypothetical protein
MQMQRYPVLHLHSSDIRVFLGLYLYPKQLATPEIPVSMNPIIAFHRDLVLSCFFLLCLVYGQQLDLALFNFITGSG